MSTQSFSLLVEMRDKITAPLKGIRSPLKQFSAGVTGAKQNLKQLNNVGRELNFAEKATASLEKLTDKLDYQRKKLAELQSKLVNTDKLLANGDSNPAYDKLQKRIDSQVAAIKTLEAKEAQYQTQLSATRRKLQGVGIETTDLKHAREQLTQITDTARAADIKYKQTLQGIKSLAPAVGRSLSGLKVTALATAASVGGIGYGMTRLTGDLAKTAKDLTAASEAFNTDTQTLQIWQLAGSSVSDEITPDKVRDYFKDFQDKVGDFSLNGTGEAKDSFEKLNLDIKKFKKMKPDQAILAFGRAFDKSKLFHTEKTNLLEGLANDATYLLPLLKDNAKALRDMEKLAKDANVLLSEKDIKTLSQANKQASELGMYWKGAKKEFTVAVADIWVKSGVNVILKDWLRIGVAFAKWKMDTYEFQSFIKNLPDQLRNGANKAMELGREIVGFIGEVKDAVLYVKDLAGSWKNLLIGFIALRSAGTLVALGQIASGLFGIMGGAKVARTGLNLVGKGLAIVGKGVLIMSRAILLNPIGLLVSAVAGAGYLIYRHWDKITQSFHDFKARVSHMTWPDIATELGKSLITLPAKLFKWGVDSLTSLTTGLLSDWGLLERGTADKVNDFIGSFSDIPNRLNTFGIDIIKGLANGIRSSGQYLWDEATNLVNGLIVWVKDLLGIRSPSRVFSEIGGYIMDGMVTGILGAKDALFTAVGNILDTLKAKSLELINDVLAIPSKIKQGISDLKSKAVDIAVNMKDGAIAHGQAAWSGLKSITNNIVPSTQKNADRKTHKRPAVASRHTVEQIIKERKVQHSEPSTVEGEITVRIEAPKGYNTSTRIKKSPMQNIGLTANVGKAAW